jgi:hypothetical protein
MTELIIVILFIIGAFFVWYKSLPDDDPTLTREGRKERDLRELWGELNTTLICPHCQFKGKVRTRHVNRKKGISGAKATGAILTGGISVLATGLSRKEGFTQAHCENCNSTWDF